jgi:hypothetical protein|tara:strand:- start:377 stop:517 length:141 start_codon:yes stop_codon:yes gene_type:complete
MLAIEHALDNLGAYYYKKVSAWVENKDKIGFSFLSPPYRFRVAELR